MFRIRHLFLASFPRNGCSQTQCQDCQESRKRRERRNGQKPAKTRTRSQTRQEWVGGGAPPRGGFNPPPHLGGQRRAGLELGIFGMISKFFFEILRPKFVPLSLFLSPQGPPGTANPAPKSGKVCFFRFLNRFFRVSKRTSILTSKNHRKICEKHRFWGPKPLPKPLQNQCKIDVPKNMPYFIDCCLMFSFLLIFDFLKISVSPRREHYF